MSLINRVLKDLDRKGNAAQVPAGVRPVTAGRPHRRVLSRTVVILLAAGAVAGGTWFVVRSTLPPAAPVRLAKPAPQTAVPVPSAPALATQEAAPPSPAPATPQESAPLAPTGSVPLPAAPAEAPEPPRPVVQQPAAPQTEPPRRATPPQAKSAEPPAAVVSKELRPATAQEQAEQTYRQALRAAERGQATEARRLLQTALEADPAHTAARQTLVALLLEAGDTGRAEVLLREGATLHAGEPWFHKGLGQLALQRGDYAQAAEWLSGGLARAGADANYWGLAAGALAKVGRNTEALAAYREAVRLQPGHGPWWIGLGLALETAGERAQAAAAFRRAGQTPLSAELSDFVERKLTELGQ